MDYIIHLCILVGMYFILAQSFNLVFGLGTLFNLAHVAIYAIGAYTTALLSTEAGFSPWICIPASCLISSLFALIIAGISLKLSQDYFSIGSLAFSSVITALLVNWKSLTHGVLGIPSIPRPDLFNIDFNENINFLYLTYILSFITGLIIFLIFKSPYARSLRGQAEHEYAAMALGRNTKRIRTYSFIISSFFAGLAGSLFAYYINYIDPSSFSLVEMVFILTIVIVGKPGSFWGVSAATIFLVLLPEPLRFIEISPSILGPMRQMLYALILFAVVFVNKQKLFPTQRSI